MRWADKDGDGVVGVSEFSSLMFDTVRWVCPNSLPKHVRFSQVGVSEFSSLMFDTVRWVWPNSPPSCSIQSGGCVRILLPHVRYSQVGVSEFSSLSCATQF
jgi:hypothetical protein